MSIQEDVWMFWAECFEESTDKSPWITFHDAYKRYKEYSPETEIQAHQFHQMSSDVKKTEKEKTDADHCYKVKMISKENSTQKISKVDKFCSHNGDFQLTL